MHIEEAKSSDDESESDSFGLTTPLLNDVDSADIDPDEINTTRKFSATSDNSELTTPLLNDVDITVDMPDDIITTIERITADEKSILEILFDAAEYSENSKMGIFAKRLGKILSILGFSTEFVNNLILGSKGTKGIITNSKEIKIIFSLTGGMVTAVVEGIRGKGLPQSIHNLLTAETYLQKSLEERGFYLEKSESSNARKAAVAFANLVAVWISVSTAAAEAMIIKSVISEEGPDMLRENYGLTVSSDLEFLATMLAIGRACTGPGFFGTDLFSHTNILDTLLPLLEKTFAKTPWLEARVGLNDKSLERINAIETFCGQLVEKLNSMSDKEFNQSYFQAKNDEEFDADYQNDNFVTADESNPEIKQQTSGYASKFISYTVTTACAAAAWWLFYNAGEKSSKEVSGLIAKASTNVAVSYATGAALYTLLVKKSLSDFLDTLFASDVTALEKIRSLAPSLLAMTVAYFSSMFIPGMIDKYMSEEDGHSYIERQSVLAIVSLIMIFGLSHTLKEEAEDVYESVRSYQQKRKHKGDESYIGDKRREMITSLEALPRLLRASLNSSLINSVYEAMFAKADENVTFNPGGLASREQQNRRWFDSVSSETPFDWSEVLGGEDDVSGNFGSFDIDAITEIKRKESDGSGKNRNYGTFAPGDITSPPPPQRKKPWFGGDSSESDSDDEIL